MSWILHVSFCLSHLSLLWVINNSHCRHKKHVQAEVTGTSKSKSNTSAPSAERLDSTNNAAASASSEDLEAVTKRRKYETDMMERKAILEADPFGREVTPKTIVCNGCDKRIQLDRRSDYYPGLWVKHRDKCLTKPHVPPKVVQAF